MDVSRWISLPSLAYFIVDGFLGHEVMAGETHYGRHNRGHVLDRVEDATWIIDYDIPWRTYWRIYSMVDKYKFMVWLAVHVFKSLWIWRLQS